MVAFGNQCEPFSIKDVSIKFKNPFTFFFKAVRNNPKKIPTVFKFLTARLTVGLFERYKLL